MGARPRAFIYHTNVLAGGSWLLFHFYPHLFHQPPFFRFDNEMFQRPDHSATTVTRVLHYFNISNKNTNITNWRVDDLDREGTLPQTSKPSHHSWGEDISYFHSPQDLLSKALYFSIICCTFILREWEVFKYQTTQVSN